MKLQFLKSILTIQYLKITMNSLESSTKLSSSSSLPHNAVSSSSSTNTLHRKGKNGRYIFEYEGRTIYEWEQSLDEINIYIQPPPSITRQDLIIKINTRHLYVGLKAIPNAYIDEDTFGPVIVDDSTWTLSDGEINITLHKMNKAELWDSALVGRNGLGTAAAIDDVSKEEVKKKLLLERFQEEVNNSYLR